VEDKKKSPRETIDFSLRIISCVLTLGAVIIGGFWTYHQYSLAGEDGWSINLSLETEVLPYRDNLRLLVVHVVSKNARPYASHMNIKDRDSFKLLFREIPTDLKEGVIINDDKIPPTKSADILTEGGGEYSFLPSSELRDTRTFIVSKDKIIAVTAEIQDGLMSESYVSATKIVRID